MADPAVTDVDWSMGSSAAHLADWRTALQTARRVAGPGVSVPPVERARMREDFGELVPRAEELIREHTGLAASGFRSRAWVMGRSDWARQNLGGLQRLLEPLAARILEARPTRSSVRRKGLGVQMGALLGYVSRKVLGQYDVFLPPDDEGLLYFVGPNVAEVERRFVLPPRDFRLWIALHEVTHRVQFDAAPWLRGYLSEQVELYLGSISLDSKELVQQVRRAVEEAKAGADWRGAGGVFLLLSPAQREIFVKTQAMMSLLEGHASFVMTELAREHVNDVDRMRRALKARRRSTGVEKTFQRAIGFDQKIAQYDLGERFVRAVVERVGMDGLNLVWRSPADLPTLEEVGDPDRWLARVPGR